MIRRLSILLRVMMIAPVATIVCHAQSVFTHHVPDTVISGAAQSTGLLPADLVISLDVVLPLRDRAGLQNFLSDVYNPASLNYGNFLSVQEFTERFGPTQTW